MADGVLAFGNRFLVWIVASFSAVETLIQFVVSLLEAYFLYAYLWLLGSSVIFGLAGLAERVKVIREG